MQDVFAKRERFDAPMRGEPALRIGELLRARAGIGGCARVRTWHRARERQPDERCKTPPRGAGAAGQSECRHNRLPARHARARLRRHRTNRMRPSWASFWIFARKEFAIRRRAGRASPVNPASIRFSENDEAASSPTVADEIGDVPVRRARFGQSGGRMRTGIIGFDRQRDSQWASGRC
ncbi:hypothetical protein AQ611_20870 [Burkholderia singularis]|nr:hypothetical protein AQ611_20870 [Burkholderia sp. Bp7605]